METDPTLTKPAVPLPFETQANKQHVVMCHIVIQRQWAHYLAYLDMGRVQLDHRHSLPVSMSLTLIRDSSQFHTAETPNIVSH